MESNQLHHHPQSHGIHNQKKKKKKLAKLTYDLHQSTSSMRLNSMATTDLNGNDLGGERERERERGAKKVMEKRKEKGRGEDSEEEKGKRE